MSVTSYELRKQLDYPGRSHLLFVTEGAAQKRAPKRFHLGSAFFLRVHDTTISRQYHAAQQVTESEQTWENGYFEACESSSNR
jgi:hypothetical protein